MEIAQLKEVEKDLSTKLTKANDNEKRMEKDIENLNAQIGKLQNKLKTQHSIFTEALEGNNILTQQYEQQRRRIDENEQTINILQMEIARLSERNDNLTKDNEMVEKEQQKLNFDITKLQNELKTYQSIINEGYNNNDNLRQQYQHLEARNNENEHIIDNLQIEIARLMEFNDELTKDKDNQKMKQTILDEKLEASRKLAKWTEAMKMKEPFIKPEQKAAYDHALECLKFMTKKHGSTLNTSELTTDIQQLTKEEFTDAIDNFVKTCENSGKLLQKCKDIVEFLERE
uniref:Uncharacterized protein n=1 Tax=Panagrolaimus sp. JU765 TaxID=591449 RepID=A0AC34QC55_9BILA